MRWNSILFDLDGTITNSAPGITNSIIYARKKWGLPVGPNEEYYQFIGPPMPESYEQFYELMLSAVARSAVATKRFCSSR